LSHLRFTPAEYQAVADARHRLDLVHFDPPSFRSILALSVADHSSALAARVLRFTDGQVRLLYDHLRPKPPALPRQRFTPEEWRTLLEACRTFPPSARFARPLQRFLIACFRDWSPELGRKVARMDAGQFEWLLGQVRRRRQGNV
jgi:hypothetical protein